MANNRELSQFANVVGYNGGNIGIGTDNPPAKLSVDGSVIFGNTTSSGSGGTLRIVESGNAVYIQPGSNTSNNSSCDLIFSSINGATEKLRITSDGTLNILNGTINLGIADSLSGHINAFENMSFNIDSDSDDSNRHFTWYKNGESGGGTGMMRLTEDARLVIGGDLGTSANNLTLKHATSVEIDMNCTGSSGNNIRIKSDSAGVFTIRDHSAGADRLTIRDNGNIGIGTDTISNNLEIFAPTNASLQIKGGNTGSDASRTAQLKLLASGSKLYVMEADATDGSFRILDSSTERLRIKSNGDLKHTGLRSGGGDNKLAILVTPSHNTNEEDVIVYQAENESSSNQITFGGGTTAYNAATQILFKTASDVDTTGGTERLRITSSGAATFTGQLKANPLSLTSSDSWIKSAYGAITNSTVSSLNNLMIAQNIRGYIQGIDGGSVNNNFYSVITHGGLGYCGTEYCYGGITKFYNNTGGTTANQSITPVERFRIESSGVTSGAGYKFSNTGSTGTSLPNPYHIGNLSSNSVAYPHIPGIYYVRADSPCDNTFRTILSSINDSTFVLEGISGDASSKRSYKLIGAPTSPGYGVNRLSEDYNTGAWNTGDIEFRLDGSHPNWNLQVKTTSYYSSANTATIRFHLFVYY